MHDYFSIALREKKLLKNEKNSKIIEIFFLFLFTKRIPFFWNNFKQIIKKKKKILDKTRPFSQISAYDFGNA